jgi:AcrR family transcriptional regulator
MSRAIAPAPLRSRLETIEKLVDAAMSEFNEQGFYGTDTNKIARRAGFAPQTFYRKFKDKTEVFIAVYERWQRLELAIMRKLLAENASDQRLVQALIAHHQAYRNFRRSLRQLGVEDIRVRAARAASRLRQIAFIDAYHPTPANPERIAATLLQLERLSDALAEDEFADMSLGTTAAESMLTRLIGELRELRPATPAA